MAWGWVTYPGWEDWLSLPSQPLIACKSLSRGGALWDLPHLWHPHWYYLLTGLVWAAMLLRFRVVSSVIYRSDNLTADVLVPWLLQPLFPWCSLSLRCRGSTVDTSVGLATPWSIVVCGQLWISVMLLLFKVFKSEKLNSLSNNFYQGPNQAHWPHQQSILHIPSFWS